MPQETGCCQKHLAARVLKDCCCILPRKVTLLTPVFTLIIHLSDVIRQNELHHVSMYR
jgi:hypothetical protein